MDKGKGKPPTLSKNRGLLSSGDGKLLPTELVDLWTNVDPALPRAEIQSIIQTTFAEFRPATPLFAQPWMQVDDKSSVAALEKARITNGGKIPAAWKAAAEESEHGRKWLKIGQEQEQAEALASAREDLTKATVALDASQAKVLDAVCLYNELNRRAQQPIKHSKTAAMDAKRAAKLATEAREAADKACEETDRARITFKDLQTARDQARVIAKNAAAKVKMLDEAEVAAQSVARGKKRKLGACKSDDD